MSDVVTVLEGPLPILDCLEDAAACELTDTCSQRPVWGRVRTAILTSLEEVSLAELALDMQEARERPAYSI
jgi:DNA-binding IscR family transcriptional regulator